MNRQTALSDAIEALLKNNGGPIDSADTVDGKSYVMVRMEDFEKAKAALATQPAEPGPGSRAAFEVAFPDLPNARHESGCYEHDRTEQRWIGWQAAMRPAQDGPQVCTWETVGVNWWRACGRQIIQPTPAWTYCPYCGLKIEWKGN